MNINERGFVINKKKLTKTQFLEIKKDLTVSPFSTFGNFDPIYFKVYQENSTELIIPVNYGTKKFKDFTINFSQDLIDCPNLKNFVGTLRPNQVECYNACIQEKDKQFGGGLINLSTASGKTVLAIKLASYYHCKTLIIVNKIELIEQWKLEIKRFLPDVNIGLIQGKNYDIEDKDIVIGMLQSISLKKELDYRYFTSFGLCIIDECHNISSEMFSKIIFKIRTRYIFGLSATLERADKLEKIIYWYIGDILFSNVSSSLKQTTDIWIIPYKGTSSVEFTLRDGTAACSKMLSNIAEDTYRSDLLVNTINMLIQNPERQILVVSDRIIQLKYLNKKLGNNISGLFIGGMKPPAILESKNKQVILATYKLVSEGFNLQKLNCLVFASSRSSINQVIGRIYRMNHVITPIIVDFYDDFSLFKAQHYRRKKLYKDLIDHPIFINKEVKSNPVKEVILSGINSLTLDFSDSE